MSFTTSLMASGGTAANGLGRKKEHLPWCAREEMVQRLDEVVRSVRMRLLGQLAEQRRGFPPEPLRLCGSQFPFIFVLFLAMCAAREVELHRRYCGDHQIFKREEKRRCPERYLTFQIRSN